MERKPRSRPRESLDRAHGPEAERIAEPPVAAPAGAAVAPGGDTLPLADLLASGEVPNDDVADRGEDPPAAGAWRNVLGAGSARQVLARLIDGDPLGIRRAVAARLRERAWLADADLVFLRAAARCAWFAARYRGERDLERRLAELVDEAVLDTVREDLEAARSGGPSAGGERELAGWSDLARPLGLDPRAARTAAAVFDHLPEPERAAFFALAIEGRSLDDAARAVRSSPTECACAARRAFDAVLSTLESESQAGEARGGTK